MILRSRIVLPISAPPISDGAVVVHGVQIRAVGKWEQIRATHDGETIDLGDSILLPGLINAHCHLDYTDMAGLLAPTRSFSDWVKAIVSLKSEWSYADYAQSWLHGAAQLLRSGTTTVVDIEAVPELMPDLPRATPLRVLSCLEMISLRRASSAADFARAAADEVSRWPTPQRGLAPHAPYTTSLELLVHAGGTARRNRWLLTSHVAESTEEFQMFTRSRGRMFDWLKAQRNMSDCVGRTPVEHADAAGLLGPGFIAAHANAVTTEDIALLARRGVHVAHCPRSHAYFKHTPFQYVALRDAGVNVCLGTDSMATVRKQRAEAMELNLFSEMRAFAKANPEVAPAEIVRLATVNGARALGCAGEIGELSPGAAADCIAIPASGTDPYEAVITHRGSLCSMIGGRWVLPPSP